MPEGNVTAFVQSSALTLKQRLAAKSARTSTYKLPVGDVTAAQDALQLAVQGGESDARVAAQEALDACYMDLSLKAMAASDYEAVGIAHPADEKGQYVPDFMLEVIAGTVQDADMDADDWRTAFTSGAWSSGERLGLFYACNKLNFSADVNPF